MKLNKKLLGILIIFMVVINYHSDAQLLNTVVALTGNVFDAVTKEPVTVFMIVKDQQGNKIGATRSNAFENGYYYVTGLKPGQTYTVLLSKAKSFMEKYEIFIANSDKYEEISRDFLVKPMYDGVRIPIPVPPFELNKSKLRFGAEDILSDIKNTLVNNDKVKFIIECYPEDDASKQDNEELTSERCKSLMNYFISNGIDGSRVSMKSHNSTDPVNPPPKKKRAKGKRYIGSTYVVVTEIK
jgi:outer membrane protein OmpA-like peptidoglycan-associated protein